MTRFEYTAVARDAVSVRERIKFGPGLKRIGVWTDGLSISSETEPNWRPAFELIEGKTYKITIEEVVAPFSLSDPQFTQAREQIYQRQQEFTSAVLLRMKGGVSPHTTSSVPGKTFFTNENDVIGKLSRDIAGRDWLEADQIVFAEVMRLCANRLAAAYLGQG